jgi:hypothetical protein
LPFQLSLSRNLLAFFFSSFVLCGNHSGEVDLYEFVQLYGDVSKTNTHEESIVVSAGDILQNDGHRLNLRTVECCTRIIHIRNGFGHGNRKREREEIRVCSLVFIGCFHNVPC